MKRVDLENQLQQIDVKASKLFDGLLKRQSKINFYETIDFDKVDLNMNNVSDIVARLDETGDIDVLPLLEYRSEFSGHVKDVRPIYVSDTGILVSEDENATKTYLIKFESIANPNDKLRLIELMEENIVNL